MDLVWKNTSQKKIFVGKSNMQEDELLKYDKNLSGHSQGNEKVKMDFLLQRKRRSDISFCLLVKT